MNRRKNSLIGAGVLFIATLMILSSVVAVADTKEYEIELPTAAPDTTYAKNPIKDNTMNKIEKNFRGVINYGCNLHNDPNQNLVWFDSTTPDTFNDIQDISSADFLSGGCFVGDVWWVCEYSTMSSDIYTVDETTGDMTLVGPSGVGLNGLAYDPSTDTLYGCSSTDLYTIDQGNGDSSPIGPFETEGLMIGIACDMDGKMYGEDLGTDSLYEIDTSTGTATLIGALGIDLNYAQDIAYDKINDILYSTGYKGSGFGGGAYGTLDLSDGHYTKIGDFPLGRLGVPSEVDALAIPYGDVNEPPAEPDINGPDKGKAGEEYCWTFQAVDPDGDDVKFVIDWGDGSTEETDCIPSGQSIEVCHTYTEEGVYTIKVKAVDCPHGLESDWSTFTVTMPRNKAIYNPFLQFLKNHPNLFPILRQLVGL